jgi:hypothetical protein
LKVDNTQRSKVFNKKIEKMGPVMLDITNFSTLYDAWSASCVEEIEGFNCNEVAQSFFQDTPNGNSPIKTKCVKETWISELPKVLLFTINRVHYDLK